MLADVFELRFDNSTQQARDRLWTNVVTAHRRWLAAQD
jgi:septum formation topological specificity factor MinE